MLTDWVLIHRLAAELDERLRGARIEDAGLLPDGRVALVWRRRGVRGLLAVDVFASPPLVTIEEGELGISAEPGFVRALERSLRGMTVAGISARRDDRLLRMTFSARSRFGVGDELELFAELVPRFGNLVLVKAGRIVAALKEFAPSDNAQRSIGAGQTYALPPLPANPRMLAPSPPEALAAPLHVYRRDGILAQAYVAPLDGFGDAEHDREPSLLQLFAELRAQQRADAGSRRNEQRRRALLRRLDARDSKLRAERERLAEKRRRAGERDSLRTEGDAIFATLHELGDDEREAAKERAREVFASYKKLAKSLPHVTEREHSVDRALEAVDALRWESERASDEDLDEVEAAVDALLPHAEARHPSPPRRKRALLELRTPQGSRIAVGRSPVENAELTFRHARPNDLWFHARGIPGAHVILSREDRSAAPDEDLRTAASLAAFYSRAKAATSVPVDYTQRKHVRKQRAAPPGLVWYTEARTIVVQPRAIESLG